MKGVKGMNNKSFNNEFERMFEKLLFSTFGTAAPSINTDEKPQPKIERIRLKRADILAMIDLALMTHDCEWFNELTDELTAMPV